MNVTTKVVAVIAVAALYAVPASAQEKIKEGAEATKDAVVQGTKTAVGATKAGFSKTGEEITDAWITTHVHARFVGETLLKDSDINVDTDKHVVTLKGTVTARAGRTRAGNIAKQIEGVHKVINRLTVGPKVKS